MLSGRGRCVGTITHPEESYGVWCFSLSVIATLRKVRLSPGIGLRRHGKKNNLKYRDGNTLRLLLQLLFNMDRNLDHYKRKTSIQGFANKVSKRILERQ